MFLAVGAPVVESLRTDRLGVPITREFQIAPSPGWLTFRQDLKVRLWLACEEDCRGKYFCGMPGFFPRLHVVGKPSSAPPPTFPLGSKVLCYTCMAHGT